MMLGTSEIWQLAGALGVVCAGIALLILIRRKGNDYNINRHEQRAPFDLGQQQRELETERLRMERARRNAEAQSRALSNEAARALQQAANIEGEELKAMASDALVFGAQRDAVVAAHEAEAQAAVRRQREEVAALLRRQEDEIARVRAEQEIELRKADFERAREAHFNVLKRVEPRPVAVSCALKSPMQEMADVMQAGYAQVAWALLALARRLAESERH